jgi:DNA-binding transcriptional LysR family regulator
MWEQFIGQRGFTLDRLATLCRVADHGGIMAAARHGLDMNRAADQGIAEGRQSQYSRQIAELEKFLSGTGQVRLLDRRRRPAELTPEGLELARLVRSFLCGLEDYVAQQRAGDRRLVIGAGERLIQWLLMPTMLPALREKFPQISVLFLNRQTQDIVKGLEESSLDLGLLRKGALKGTNLAHAGSWWETYHFFLSSDVRPKLPLPPKVTDLGPYPLAVLEGAGETRAAVVRLFERAGICPNIQLECSSLTQVAQAVEMGYAAFLPHLAISRCGPKIQAHRIPGLEELDTEQTLAWNPDRTIYRPLILEVIRVLTGV